MILDVNRRLGGGREQQTVFDSRAVGNVGHIEAVDEQFGDIEIVGAGA